MRWSRKIWRFCSTRLSAGAGHGGQFWPKSTLFLAKSAKLYFGAQFYSVLFWPKSTWSWHLPGQFAHFWPKSGCRILTSSKFDIWCGRFLKIVQKFWKIFKIGKLNFGQKVLCCAHVRASTCRISHEIRHGSQVGRLSGQRRRWNHASNADLAKIKNFCSTRLAAQVWALLAKKCTKVVYTFGQICAVKHFLAKKWCGTFWPKSALPRKFGQILARFGAPRRAKTDRRGAMLIVDDDRRWAEAHRRWWWSMIILYDLWWTLMKVDDHRWLRIIVDDNHRHQRWRWLSSIIDDDRRAAAVSFSALARARKLIFARKKLICAPQALFGQKCF